MRTLSRYFVARYAGLFVLILAGATLAIATVELLLGFDEVTGPSQLLGWLLVRIPSYYLRDLVPIAAFFATFFTLALAVRWLEWTAVQAGGVSPLRIAIPLLVTSAVLATTAAAVREIVLPPIVEQHQSVQRSSDEDLLFRAGSFWYQKGRSIYSIGSADRTTGTLRGVEVFERTPRGRLKANFLAETASVRPDGSWLLENAIVREFHPDEPERPMQVSRVPALVLSVSQSSALLLEQTDAAGRSLPELIEYVETHRSDDHPGSRAALHRLELVIHQRLSEPWVAVLFTLLAIPIALAVRPGGSLAPAAVLSVLALGAFYLARSVLDGLVGQSLLPAPETIWAVPTVFTIIGVIALVRRLRSNGA